MYENKNMLSWLGYFADMMKIQKDMIYMTFRKSFVER